LTLAGRPSDQARRISLTRLGRPSYFVGVKRRFASWN
jgi:hypothetical protein